MSHRPAKFASAILASFLANAPLVTTSYSATPAADDCLSGPKDQTPAGSHWFYRIERGTKRHCWYLKDENDKASQAVPADSSAAAQPLSPNADTPVQRSVADARAELPLPQTRFEPAPAMGAVPRMATPAINAASPVNAPGATAQDPPPQASVIASRWPDPSSTGSSADPGPATDDSDADAQASLATAPPAVVPTAPAAADVSAARQPVSMQTLLLVVIGALALAGLIGSAIFRLASRRRTSRRPVRGDRRAIWDSAAIDRPSQPNYPAPRARTPRVDFPRELCPANDPNDRIADDRITEMLARLARSSMN